MPVVELLTKEDYNVIKTSKLVVIHFYADWAEQCQVMNDVLEEMSKKDDYKDVLFTKILAEQMSEISLKHRISAVPTTLILKDSKEAVRIDGANPSQLTEKLTSLIRTSKQSSGSDTPLHQASEIPTQNVESLEERLKKLINAAPVMLFMKGNADHPRCGFSRKIVDILREHNVQFKTFDILNDPDIREGLKKYSNWPTYPQLYINGELIGGLDIVKELVEAGEFSEKLPKSYTLEERLKSLISKSKVMVFMKGNRTKPRCGFSKQLIEILDNSGSKYETFDILEDEEVRQGLKKFSNWPTYPQIYVKGELIGGLDIIKEHLENGELNTILN